MKTIVACLISVAMNLCIACGVFTPREIATQPAVQTETVDPFGLSRLLEGTGATFSRFAWQEFFHLNLKYTNVNIGSDEYTKEALVNHLQQQLDVSPGIMVTWEEPQSVSQEADRITLTNVVYVVTDSSASDRALFSGSSDFEIIRDASASVWRIIIWKDLSANSFFSPAD
jgi:hypothetical protein